ncbi:SDR family NAD(P)-dependent oxidoreductase [Nocardiopsis listeri]|uniref:SDR family NAD(P)-dependent oxidoreductase n=1 Tax=Nocardiopsis listeri TaxID=53440 RepID=UPI000A01CBB9|nr:SDR family NAD(P)-dependent oxidoreductase [Nocardiopsis listeri]
MRKQSPSKKTVVVQGGTDGMGRGMVMARLKAGDTVIALGSNVEKGRRLSREAAALGAGDRFRFIRANLSSIAENERVVAEIREQHPVIDALVLCANRQAPQREVSPEGLEFTFGLYYLSRYLLSHGLRAEFDAAPAPVIINIAAAGLKVGKVNFADLQFEEKYSTIRAQMQAGRTNDLLGRSLADEPSSKARIVLYHPGFTKTLGGIAHLKQPVKGIITFLSKVAAKSVEAAIAPMVAVIDSPPSERLTGINQGKSVDLTMDTFDPARARKLAEVTRRLVVTHHGQSPLLPEAAKDRDGKGFSR